MIKTIVLICLLLANSLFSSRANALSKRPLRAEEPHVKSWIATDELSPYPTMTFASYVSAFGAVLYFAPAERSPDYNRQQVKDMNSAAAGIVLTGGMLNGLFALISAPMISAEERAKLGPLSAADIDDDSLKREKKGFLLSHFVNTAAIAAVASQSVREDRWSVAAIQAIFPFVVDLSARHILSSNKISPWSLSITPKIENVGYGSVLMFSCNW